MSAKRSSRVAERRRMYVTEKTAEDFPETTPVVWIQQTKEGISYGVRAYGRSLKRNTDQAIEQFKRVKRFVEVEAPKLSDEHVAEVLRESAKPASREARSDHNEER